MGAPGTPKDPLAPNRGFTVIELIVVVTVLSVLTAIIVPVYGNSISAMKARGARGDFVALVLYAQELAVRESREIRVCLSRDDGAYWLEGWVAGHGEDKRFEPLAEGAQSGVRRFPDSMPPTRIRAHQDHRRELHYIACFPNGACDRAEIAFGKGRRERLNVTIATTGALGGIEVKS